MRFLSALIEKTTTKMIPDLLCSVAFICTSVMVRGMYVEIATLETCVQLQSLVASIADVSILFRSLHNIRNYIHIHLCINLMIAQLIFVVGIDKSADDHVPAHCQAIAVLLHYFFLVSFMWMLMEGVVLYIILIRVFVGNTKKYIIGFTLASYGIPLLYMGLLTLPLGFALKDQHYGTTTA